MIVLKKTTAPPEAVWVTYGEGVGKGDGKTREFELPITPLEAHSLQIIVGGQAMREDGRRIIEEDRESGRIVRDEEDGWKIENREEGDPPKARLFVVFDKPPKFGVPITCSVIGRETKDSILAFKILPTTRSVQEVFGKKHPQATKDLRLVSLRKKKLADLEDKPLQAFFDDVFDTLVTDWRGVVEEDGSPVPCNAETKKAFLSQQDLSALFGLWVSGRSGDVKTFLETKIERDLVN